MLSAHTPNNKLIQYLQDSKSDIVILSIGSAGDDIEQQLPTFAGEAMSIGKSVSVVNIDRDFTESDLIHSGKNLEVYAFGHAIKNTTFENEELLKCLNDIVNTPDRKLIILNHISINMESWAIDFMQKHQDKIGHNVEYIGSYFQDIPVVRYSPALFQMDSQDKIKSTVQDMWSKWTARFDKNLGDNQYNTMPTSLLSAFREQIAPFGVLYRNLASLPYQDLFSVNPPTPIIGLNEGEYQAYVDHLIKNIDAAAPMYDAAKKNLLPVIQQLVLEGIDINSTNAFGRTALMEACGQGNKAMVEWLLQNGANISAVASNDETAIMFAIFNHHKEISNYLIEVAPSVLEGEAGLKTLITAIEYDPKFANTIIDLSPSLIEGENGKQLLLPALRGGDSQLVMKLIEHNPSVLEGKAYNTEGDAYDLALHLAKYKNMADLVSFIEARRPSATAASSSRPGQ